MDRWADLWLATPNTAILLFGINKSGPETVAEIFLWHATKRIQRYKFDSIRVEQFDDAPNEDGTLTIRALHRKSGIDVNVFIAHTGTVTLSVADHHGRRNSTNVSSHLENPKLLDQFEAILSESVQRINLLSSPLL